VDIASDEPESETADLLGDVARPAAAGETIAKAGGDDDLASLRL
jgi:hypothetical protein